MPMRNLYPYLTGNTVDNLSTGITANTGLDGNHDDCVGAP